MVTRASSLLNFQVNTANQPSNQMSSSLAQEVANQTMAMSASHTTSSTTSSRKRKFERIQPGQELLPLPLKRVRADVEPEFSQEEDSKFEGPSILEQYGINVPLTFQTLKEEEPTLTTIADRDVDIDDPQRLEDAYEVDQSWGSTDPLDSLTFQQQAQLKAVKNLFASAYAKSLIGSGIADLSYSNVRLKSNGAGSYSAVLKDPTIEQVESAAAVDLIQQQIATHCNGNHYIFNFLSPDLSFVFTE